MMSRPSLSKKSENVFCWFLWSLVVCILFTNINCVVYNWVYLERIYDKPFDRWALAKPEMFLGYWHWVLGRVLCIVNVILGIFPFILWRVLKRRNNP